VIFIGLKMKRFRYTVHNLFAHPIMEIAYIFGFYKFSAWIHDITLPKNWRDDYINSWDAGEITKE